MRNTIGIPLFILIAALVAGNTNEPQIQPNTGCLDKGIDKILYQIEKRSSRKVHDCTVVELGQSKIEKSVRLNISFQNNGQSWLTAKVRVSNPSCCTSQWTITKRSQNLSQSFSVNERFKFSCKDNYGSRKIRPGRPYPRSSNQRRY